LSRISLPNLACRCTGAPMLDLLRKAKRFYERAEQCTKLAELTTSHRMRWHYKQMAERSLALARAELTKAAEIARKEESQS
jgi:hypothetical protein